MIEKSYTGEEIAAIVRKHGLPRYPKIALLREKLSRKAKEEPQFRFYCLYGQLLREDVLKCAYEAVRANQGAPGVDGVSFRRIEHDAEGVEGFLGNILRELKDKVSMGSDPIDGFLLITFAVVDRCDGVLIPWAENRNENMVEYRLKT